MKINPEHEKSNIYIYEGCQKLKYVLRVNNIHAQLFLCLKYQEVKN